MPEKEIAVRSIELEKVNKEIKNLEHLKILFGFFYSYDRREIQFTRTLILIIIYIALFLAFKDVQMHIALGYSYYFVILLGAAYFIGLYLLKEKHTALTDKKENTMFEISQFEKLTEPSHEIRRKTAKRKKK